MRARPTPIRRTLFVMLTGIGSVLLCAVLLESALWVGGTRLPVNLANYVVTKYNEWPRGIYVVDGKTGMNFMRPNHHTQNWFNGYSFEHRTDEWGFRNAPGIRDKEVLLVGDSMVFGHGLDVEQTAAHLLRAEYGHPVYNMARQADCLYQEYLLLRLFLPRFRPKKVLLFPFINDLYEIVARRPFQYLTWRPELTHYDYGLLWNDMHALWRGTPTNLRSFLMNFRAMRLYHALEVEALAPPVALWPKDEQTGRPEMPHFLVPLMNLAWFRPAAQYFGAVMADLSQRARQQGVELQLVDLDTRGALPRYAEAFDRMAGLVANTCRHNRLACTSTRAIFEDCDHCYLPYDGHFSVEGNRRLAKFLHKWLQRPNQERQAESAGSNHAGSRTP